MDSTADTTTKPAPSVPSHGALLGVDFGTKRLGVAVSTPEQSIASPLENITRGSTADDARTLRRLATEYHAVGVVVGLPVHMSGEEGGKAREARAFGEWVGQQLGLPVVYWDERYTSAMAELYLQQSSLSSKKQKQRLDKVAAQIMLQSFLDSPDRQQVPGRWGE